MDEQTNDAMDVEARYFSRDEYSIGWCCGEAELRIDTAPVRGECATFPHPTSFPLDRNTNIF